MLPPVSAAPGCQLEIVAFDFEAKTSEPVELEGLRAAMQQGRFVWVDADVGDASAARSFLVGLELADAEVIEDALAGRSSVHYTRFDDYLYLVLTGTLVKEGPPSLERLDAIVAEGYLLTIHQGPVTFLESMRREYRADFVRFARSPSFLVYELWDHLTSNWVASQTLLSDRVAGLQDELMQNLGDQVFSRVSALMEDLLTLRKLVVPARAVLTELATHRSAVISDATRPFLSNMVGTVERVVQDLMADREILSDSVDLYMSMVSHRTNQVMRRLTTVSVIFLPLMFVCGVYGMNFTELPEIHWKYGYLFFWGLVAVIASSLAIALRRARWF